jgi:hypothetical protein
MLRNLNSVKQKLASLLAQLAERGTVNPEAVGSIPTQRAFCLSDSWTTSQDFYSG